MVCKNCIHWHVYVVKEVGYCARLKFPTKSNETCNDWRGYKSLEGEDYEQEKH